jgi:hypothetical protein
MTRKIPFRFGAVLLSLQGGRENRNCAALRREMRYGASHINAGGTADIFALRVAKRVGHFLLLCQPTKKIKR